MTCLLSQGRIRLHMRNPIPDRSFGALESHAILPTDVSVLLKEERKSLRENVFGSRYFQRFEVNSEDQNVVGAQNILWRVLSSWGIPYSSGGERYSREWLSKVKVFLLLR